ncbi:MAG: hypothetical protein OEM15_11000 [Myxococcales bacterium]|nr:hypothetical protein [Myxococcales bacterium]MDH3483136.1 hypothetical protein [Myxococcales bacterium]
MAETTPSVPPRVFEHDSRKDWGRSVLLVEIPDKRTFLFEDGAERSFRPDYWHKMELVELQPNEAVRIDRLARRNQAPAPGSGRKSKAPPKKPDITFEQQVAYFMKLYPVGFEDEAYIKAERGEAGTKAGEKLKEAALERAEEQLSRKRVSKMVDGDLIDELHQLAYEFLVGTKSTVQKAEATRFKNMPAEARIGFAESLRELLYGDRSYPIRFDSFVAALDVEGGPTWPLATLLQALVYPTDHLFVKPTFMKKQALILDIDPKYDTTPNSTTYEQFMKAGQKTMELLQEAGQRPRDMWDVHTFICKTLSPKAIKEATGAE